MTYVGIFDDIDLQDKIKKLNQSYGSLLLTQKMRMVYLLVVLLAFLWDV